MTWYKLHEGSIIQGSFMMVCLAWIGLMSLVSPSTYTVVGKDLIFEHSLALKIISFGSIVIPLGFACFAWWLTRDRGNVVISFMALLIFVSIFWPRTLTEKLKISTTHFTNHHSFLHPDIDQTVILSKIKSAEEISKGGSPDIPTAFVFHMVDGSEIKFSHSVLLTAASDV